MGRAEIGWREGVGVVEYKNIPGNLRRRVLQVGIVEELAMGGDEKGGEWDHQE